MVSPLLRTRAPRRLATLGALVIGLSAAIPRAALAQERSGTARSHGPGWLARKNQLELGNPFSRVELAEVMARLEAIERIVMKSGAFEHPDGYQISPPRLTLVNMRTISP